MQVCHRYRFSAMLLGLAGSTQSTTSVPNSAAASPFKDPQRSRREFMRKMLCGNPVRFYRFSEGDIAAARKAKENSSSEQNLIS